VKLLLDEMFPPAAATVLRDEFGHDALHVGEVGLHGADDVVVATFARSERRAVVTENISDYAPESDLALVCVLKRKLPAGGAQARALADVLDQWVQDNPNPYVGQHWPT
jgi:predicted nuclease of predicted toxin-antitoxin system